MSSIFWWSLVFKSWQLFMISLTRGRSSVTTSCTVISFFVSVPVLSEQITVIDPNVSTAGMALIIAFSSAISLTPIERIIVKTAGRPSGIIATINAMLAENSKLQSIPYLKLVKNKRKTINAKIPLKICLFNWCIFLTNGVVCAWIDCSAWLIFPISVASPVSTTTPKAEPVCTSVPEKAIFSWSPAKAFCGITATVFSTASDSPVKIDSSTVKSWTSIKRKSAGITSPAFRITTSPLTRFSESSFNGWPSFRTVASCPIICFKPSNDSSALRSCQ